MCVVELLYLGRGYDDGSVVVVEGDEDILYGGGGVGFSNGAVKHYLGHVVSGCEECGVLVVVLLGEHCVLEVVPESLEAAGGIHVDVLHELAEDVCGVCAGLVCKGLVIGQDGRDVAAGGKVDYFVFTYADAGVLGVLDEHVPVHEVLPCGVADLLLALLVLHVGAGGDLVDRCELVYVFQEVCIRNSLAVDAADVVLGRNVAESALEGSRIDDE